MIPIKTLAKWKSTKTLSDDKTGLFSQQNNISDFKSMCTNIWERCLGNKICIFDPANECTWLSQIILSSKRAFGYLHWKLKKKNDIS